MLLAKIVVPTVSPQPPRRQQKQVIIELNKYSVRGPNKDKKVFRSSNNINNNKKKENVPPQLQLQRHGKMSTTAPSSTKNLLIKK